MQAEIDEGREPSARDGQEDDPGHRGVGRRLRRTNPYALDDVLAAPLEIGQGVRRGTEGQFVEAVADLGLGGTLPTGDQGNIHDVRHPSQGEPAKKPFGGLGVLTDVLLEEFREAHGHETGRHEADDALNQAENPLSLLVGVHPVMLTARALYDEGDLVGQHLSWRSTRDLFSGRWPVLPRGQEGRPVVHPRSQRAGGAAVVFVVGKDALA